MCIYTTDSVANVRLASSRALGNIVQYSYPPFIETQIIPALQKLLLNDTDSDVQFHRLLEEQEEE